MGDGMDQKVKMNCNSLFCALANQKLLERKANEQATKKRTDEIKKKMEQGK